MKGLFLIFHGFEAFNGISKKIRYQVKALKECGLEMHTCWLDDTDNHKRRMVDESIIADYGFGIKGKILKRIEFDSIVHYVQKENIDFIYVRYVHNASPFSIRLMKLLKKTGARIVMEIPTYPYDQEYFSIKEKIELYTDKGISLKSIPSASQMELISAKSL